MSSTATIATLIPSFPLGYFDEDNIQFIKRKISDVLSREYVQNVEVDDGSIIRIMQRVVEERMETVPKMNERVIMYITNDFRVHQMNVSKHLKLEAHYTQSQRLYDPTVQSSKFDNCIIKQPNRLGNPKVGGTVRFYFT
ncbi:MAG TPA: hypothetical protein VLE02_02135 [Nitrosarchaeum sp.]|nr:hypothetical protein [Nitrosarchaeum sp.]